MSKFEDGRNFSLVTASLDYSLKFWRPSKETLENLYALDEQLDSFQEMEIEGN